MARLNDLDPQRPKRVGDLPPDQESSPATLFELLLGPTRTGVVAPDFGLQSNDRNLRRVMMVMVSVVAVGTMNVLGWLRILHGFTSYFGFGFVVSFLLSHRESPRQHKISQMAYALRSRNFARSFSTSGLKLAGRTSAIRS